MATSFGQDVTEVSEIPSAQTPKEGVVTKPVFLEGLANIFDQAGAMLEANKANKQNKILADFTSRQLLVADALAQGRIRTSAHAQTMMRQNLLDAIEANPSLAGDFIAAQKSITGLPGGAKIVDEGTDEEKRKRNLANKLVENGIIDPDASEDEINQGIEEFRSLEEVTRRHQLRMQTLDEKLKSADLTSKERQTIQDQKKQSARNFATAVAPLEFKRVKNEFQKILTSDMPEAEKVVALQDMFAAFQSESSAVVGALDSHEASALMKPFEMLFEQYSKRVTGEIDDAELTRSNERIIALQTSLLLADPAIANFVASSKLVGDIALQQALKSSNERVKTSIFNFMAGTTPGQDVPPPSPFVEGSVEREGLQTTLGAISRGVTSSDEALKEEADERMKLIMGSVDQYEGIIRRNPKAGIELVNWFASNSFLAARNTRPELFTDIDAAKEVISRHYSDEVWGMVRREFRDNNILRESVNPDSGPFTPFVPKVTRSATPTKDAVAVRSTKSGMEFYSINPEDKQAVEKATMLNRQLKPIINNTVRAMAHLEGNSNYQQLWEGIANDFLSGGEQISGGDEGDDLSLESFRTPISALDEALTTGGYVGTGDYTDAETAEDVAASFIGFTEQEHKDVLASFVKKTIGKNINPQTTAWCAAFVNSALGASGQEGTNTFLARDFLNWGKKVDSPQRGDIVVFERGNSTWQGHVGFYVGKSDNGNLLILGGNQDDTVSIKEFPTKKVLGYRRAS